MKLPQRVKLIGKEIVHNSSFLREVYLNQKFSQEIKLFNGQKTDNSHPSILFFTLHKCASVYVGEILQELSQDTSITFIDLDNYLATSEYPSLKTILDGGDTRLHTKIKNSFQPTGYLYTSLRYPKTLELVDNLQDYQILLMLRDPRDVLASAYFSFGYTHTLPIVKEKRDRFLAWRNKIASQTLDEFVLSVKDDWVKMYDYYCQNLLGKPNVLLVKFEDMIGNFDNWLISIIEFLRLNVEPEKVKALVNTAKQKKIKPTDHQKALKPETIEILNRDFREILTLLNYK